MPHFVALAVGRDPLLLDTRSQVLRSDGYTVVTALSSEQALQQFKSGDFDLVILCHSIPISERERLADAMHRHSPNTPVVLVSRTPAQQATGGDASVASDPEQLLRDIPAILGKFPPENGAFPAASSGLRRRA
jgi:CheY-like chemotaxis protein